MNTVRTSVPPQLATPPAPPPAQPILRALALLIRINAVFCECFESTRRVIANLRAQIRLQYSWSRTAAQIDARLECEERELIQCLQNDEPDKRRRILAAWRETEKRARALSTDLDPHCPPHLLGEE